MISDVLDDAIGDIKEYATLACYVHSRRQIAALVAIMQAAISALMDSSNFPPIVDPGFLREVADSLERGVAA